MRLSITDARVDADEVADHLEVLQPYQEFLTKVTQAGNFEAPETSINLPSDLATREVVDALHQELESGALQYILVIGIGGSHLGTKAVYDAMLGHKDLFPTSKRPKIIFVSTPDTTALRTVICGVIESIESLDNILITSITKSGTTTETLVNTEVIIHELSKRFSKEAIFERFVGISSEDNAFSEAVLKEGGHMLYIPEHVGGRYSVLSPVGIFPLLSAHVDVDALLAGALDMRTRCIDPRFSENYAMQSAIALFIAARRGERIHTNFIFHPQLEFLGKWYRQLQAESIGKRENTKGEVIHAGITPEVAVGTNDLHATAQLYIGGPRDKITTFTAIENVENHVQVPKTTALGEVSAQYAGMDTFSVRSAIYEGTKRAYAKNELSFMEVVLDDVSPYEIGQYMQFRMIETMYLAKLWNIDAFNQPNVESYKEETRHILEG